MQENLGESTDIPRTKYVWTYLTLFKKLKLSMMRDVINRFKTQKKTGILMKVFAKKKNIYMPIINKFLQVHKKRKK